MADIEIKLDNMEIKPHQEIIGHITVNYSGLYDGVVINTQILGSNELVVWREYNGKKITQNVSRLFVNKNVIPDNKVDFVATKSTLLSGMKSLLTNNLETFWVIFFPLYSLQTTNSFEPRICVLMTTPS